MFEPRGRDEERMGPMKPRPHVSGIGGGGSRHRGLGG